MHLLLQALLVSVVISAGAGATPGQSAAPADCSGWQACRDMALEAHKAGDEERFHDLAWRAVQARGRRDPELLFILARAQSASGRPGDAVVTLTRLATEHGDTPDVTRDEDFRRVLALNVWSDAQATIDRIRAERSHVSDAAGDDVAAAPAGSPSAAAPKTPAPAETAKRTAAPVGTAARAAVNIEEVARFSAPSFAPGGLAYDAVSRRFVIGNLPERKLTIVAQDTNRAATLTGSTARLLGVQALEIDRRNGDLWVVSSGPRKDTNERISELHKLQLISGRVLHVFATPADLGPSRFVDVAVARGNGVLVLDAEGPRLLRPDAEAGSLTRVLDLPAGTVTSLAPADDGRMVYIAYTDRLLRVDLVSRSVSRLIGNAETNLAAFERIRWHRGSLAGVQASDGRRRLVQLRLNRSGTTVVGSDALDDLQADAGPIALDLVDRELYYLVPGASEAVIRRIRLK
jgi:hypothetical protein